MKIALEKADGKLIAEHELSGADAADALDELFMLRAGGSLGDYLDSTKGKFFAEDLVHCLRRCALGGNGGGEF